MKIITICVYIILLLSSRLIAQPKTESFEDSILTKYLKQGAWKQKITSPEYGRYIDSALALLPKNAYLWQQRGMPYWKQMKYEVALRYTDSAVKYDTLHWLDYRAFCKCIFQKSYKEAIADFLLAKKAIGNSVVMDHDYDFYMGLCYLQLAKYDSAEKYFGASIKNDTVTFGSSSIHHLHSFYLGIVFFEKQQYARAMALFDLSLITNPKFADAEYYKSACLRLLGNEKAADALFAEAEEHFFEGRTINEDNAVYERYPYQVKKEWFHKQPIAKP